MKLLCWLVLATGVAGCATHTQRLVAPADSAELTRLYDEDQSDRDAAVGSIDWTRVGSRDAARRERVDALLRTGALHSARDYLHAAMIFQHGTQFADVRLAQALAILAMTIDPGNEQARWLTAACLDRMLVYKVQAQWYGTQYASDDAGIYLHPVADSAVNDEERRALHVPTLAEAQRNVEQMASVNHLKVRPAAPTLDSLRQQQKVP